MKKIIAKVWLPLSVSIQLSSAAYSDANNVDLIPFHYQSATALQSDYTYNGIKYTDFSTNFSLRADVDFNDYSTFSAKLWTVSGIGDDFYEIAGFIEYTKSLGDLTYIFSTGYKNLSNSQYRSGLETSFGLSKELEKNNFLQWSLSYDQSASGWYSSAEFIRQYEVKENHFLDFKLGAGVNHNYYNSSGFSDVYGSMHYTLSAIENISITPFMKASLINRDNVSRLTFGVSLEINF